MAIKKSRIKRKSKRKTRRGGAALESNQRGHNEDPNQYPLKQVDLPKNFNALTPEELETMYRFWEPCFERDDLRQLKNSMLTLCVDNSTIAKMIGDPLAYSKGNLSARGNPMAIMYAALDNYNEDLCDAVQQIFPAYYNPVVLADQFNDLKGSLALWDNHFKMYKITCAATMILYGIIAVRLLRIGDFQIIFKGGRALQMGGVLGSTSHDVDIMIECVSEGKYTKDYEQSMIQNIAGNLALLMKELLPFKTSILPPESPNANKFIYKISSVFGNQYVALSDIDFKPISEEAEKLDLFGDRLMKWKRKVLLGTDILIPRQVLFTFPTLKMMLEEKTFLYDKYETMVEELTRGVKIEGETLPHCINLRNKFKEAKELIERHLKRMGIRNMSR